MKPVPVEEDAHIDTLVKLVSSRRNDYRAAEEKFEKAQLNLRMQKNAMLPSLDLTSNYYIYGTDADFSETFGKMRDNDYNSWSVGVNMSAPIGSRSINDKLLPYKIAVSEAQYQKVSLERKIRQELKTTISSLTLNYKQYNSSSGNIEIAKINFTEAQQLHEKGFITFEEFLKSRKNKLTSELQLFRSQCEYTTNFYKLKRAKGLLLDLFTGSFPAKKTKALESP
jgi:outer membrane protein TolC